MTGMVGADPTELRGLAAHFDSKAAVLHQIEAHLTWRIHSAPWQGADVSRFLHDWNATHRKVLVAAAGLMMKGAQELRTQADQQDRASAAAGGGGLTQPASTASMKAYVASHPLHLSDDPAKAAAEWARLSPAQRQAYIKFAPEIVGQTDGLPAEDRSAANKIRLADTKQEFGRRLSDDKESLQDYLGSLRTFGSRLPMLGDVYNFEVGGFISPQESIRLDQLHHAVAYDEKILGNAKAVAEKLRHADELGTEGFLLIYQPEAFGGDGRAAIAFGNPDHATNTAVIVPGLNATIQEQYSGNRDAEHLYQQMANTSRGTSTSVVAYMGYDAPEISTSVLTETRAMEGGRLLRDDVAGLQAAHDGTPSHLTVIGHSYGSTTVSDAVVQGLRADDYVLIGSPGMGHATPSDFGGSSHLYTGSASQDLVADSSWFGTDPALIGSDSTRFHAESVNRGGPYFGLIADHLRYYDVDTAGGGFRPSESLANIATIANGQHLTADEIARHKFTDIDGNVVDPEAKYQPTWGTNENKE